MPDIPELYQIERLSMEYAYLFSPDTKKTMREMAKALKLPVEVVRGDFSALMTSPYTKNTMDFVDYNPDNGISVDSKLAYYLDDIHKKSAAASDISEGAAIDPAVFDEFESLIDVRIKLEDTLLQVESWIRKFEKQLQHNSADSAQDAAAIAGSKEKLRLLNSKAVKIKKRLKKNENIILCFITDGKLDDAFIEVFNTDTYNVPSGHYLLPLNKLQLDKLSLVFPEYEFPYSAESLYFDKCITRHIDRAALKLIHDAILNGSAIAFNYENAQGEITYNLKCYPSKIRFNAADNTSYCFNDKNHIFRLDRMSDIRIYPLELPDDGSEFYDDDFEHLWAMPDGDHTIYHVKCCIRPRGLKNTINKIKSDLRRRASASLAEQADGTLLYEDDIVGMNAFIPWVRSYGTTIEVIEPEWLARQLYEEALEKIRRLSEN